MGLSPRILNILDKPLNDAGFWFYCFVSIFWLLDITKIPAEAENMKSLFPSTPASVWNHSFKERWTDKLCLSSTHTAALPLNHGSAHRREKPTSVGPALDRDGQGWVRQTDCPSAPAALYDLSHNIFPAPWYSSLQWVVTESWVPRTESKGFRSLIPLVN